MSQNEQVAYQEQLGKMQNDYGVKQQQLVEQLHEEQNRKLIDVRLRVETFLKKYAKAHGFSYVLATADNDNIYYKETSRNITADLVDELNKSESK